MASATRIIRWLVIVRCTRWRKYKLGDKVGLPCARLLSIRQEPTCSPSKDRREASFRLVSAVEHVLPCRG